MTLQKYKSTILYVSILLLAFVLRLIHLSDESIWLDEGISIAMGKLNFAQLLDKSAVDTFPPLYYLMLHYWMLLFGDSEFSARFLSLLFSMATIIVTYQLCKHLWQEKVATIAAFLLAISVFHIEHAQEVRMYSLVSFLSVSSCYLFLKWKEKQSTIWVVLLFIFNLLFLYSHILAIFFIAAQNIYYLSLIDKGAIKLKSWIIFNFLLLLCFAPWIQMFLYQASAWQSTTWMPTPSARDIIGTFTTYSGSVLLTLIFAILISKALFKYKIEKQNFYFLIYWLFLPSFLLLAFCFIFHSIYLQKYTIASSIPFFILVAYSIQSFKQKKHKAWLLSAITILAGIKLAVYYVEDYKEQWRDAVALVESKAEKEDVVLFDAAYCKHNAFDYYARRADLIKLPLVDVREEVNERNVLRLDTLSNGVKSTWLVLSHSRDAKGLVKKKITHDYEVLYHEEFIGVEVYRLKRRAGQ
ncbi:MAG: glycosyltransferase family 39 protein [Flavobacteriales bacterium]